MQWFFLTGLYSGLSPKAPGTAGSVAALVLGAAVLLALSVETLALLTLLITLMGVREINKLEKRTGVHDDGRIVIDEFSGMWITLLIIQPTWPQMILGFLFFRLYDIWKPSFIGKIDRDVPGGLGVMGDDVLAGFVAGISTALVTRALLQFGIIL